MTTKSLYHQIRLVSVTPAARREESEDTLWVHYQIIQDAKEVLTADKNEEIVNRKGFHPALTTDEMSELVAHAHVLNEVGYAIYPKRYKELKDKFDLSNSVVSVDEFFVKTRMLVNA